MAFKRTATFVFMALACIGTTLPSAAGDVEITAVEARQAANGTWRFDVTLRHGDTGWDHYANLWQVELPDGTVLGERVLAHPHVEEQPFTRSLGNVAIPDSVKTVVIRARDSVHGFSDKTFSVELAD